MVAVGDSVFFVANDGVHGRELWKSDGTENGTVMVKNINPHDAERRRSSRPRYLSVIRGTVYFSATDGTHGEELWRSDGTRAGTVMVKDIDAPGSGAREEMTATPGGLFFTAHDRSRGRQLWKSDGTRSGTVLVRKIAPVWGENYYGAPHYLTAMGRRVYFAADDNRHGVELWRSNGTRSGTVMVKNIDRNQRNDAPDYPGAMPRELTRMNGRIYFNASADDRGEELWRTDGSRLGTVMVKEIDDRRWAGGQPLQLTRARGELLFTAIDRRHGRELWSTDGTRSGTAMVKNIVPSGLPGGDYDRSPSSLTPARDQLYFYADDGTSGAGLWKSDGSRGGTLLVKAFGGEGSLGQMVAVGNQVFFAGADGTPGLGLWRSDGSTEGTALLKDFGSCDDSYYPRESAPAGLAAVRQRVFFAAEDVAHGEELWVSDGTANGTVLVKDIRAGTTG
jgi:ELWxxDGT repeat protein